MREGSALELGGGLPGPAESWGRWRVWTESSCYLIDLKERWIIRERGAGVGPLPDLPPLAEASTLRRDGDQIPLLEMYQLEIGKPMIMLLDVRGDGVSTVRTTTYVRGMEPA